MKTITIIIPIYKVEKYLVRCLDSIISQTFTDWECILIDDGSPDNSRKICEEYALKDLRFRLIHQENKGVSVARNVGLAEAKSEWIVFVDSDDWCAEYMLQDMYESALNNNADIILGGYYITNGKKIYSTILPNEEKLIMPDNFSVRWQCPWGKLIKKSVIEENSILFPNGITLAEDLFFSFQLFYNCHKIYGLKKPIYYYYYQNNESICHTMSKKNIQDEITVLRMIDNIIKDNVNIGWTNFLKQRKVLAKNKYIFSIQNPDFFSWKNSFIEINIKDILRYSPISYKPVLLFACKEHFILTNILLKLWKIIRYSIRF